MSEKKISLLKKTSGLIAVIVIMLIVTFTKALPNSNLTIALDDTKIGIANSFTESIEVYYSEIQNVILLNSFELREKINVDQKDEILIGEFENRIYGNVQVYIHNESNSYILLEVKNSKLIVINLKTDKLTEDFYQQILEKGAFE